MTLSFFSPELEEAVSLALLKVSADTKAAMTKAVLAALGGFKDMMDNMEVKMKTLLQDKVNVGTLIKVNKLILYLLSFNFTDWQSTVWAI